MTYEPIKGFVGFDVPDSVAYPEAGTHVEIVSTIEDVKALAIRSEPFPIYRKIEDEL